MGPPGCGLLVNVLWQSKRKDSTSTLRLTRPPTVKRATPVALCLTEGGLGHESGEESGGEGGGWNRGEEVTMEGRRGG